MKPSHHKRKPAREGIIWLLLMAAQFIAILPSMAQEPNRWKTYTLHDGLDGNNPLWHLVLVGLGFLCTVFGLQRFDGYAFKTYKEDPDDSLGFHWDSDVENMGLYTDDAGDLWVHDNVGKTCRYDFEKDGFVQYPQFPKFLRETFMAGNKNGFWIGTEGKGLFYVNPVTGETQKYFNAGEDSLASVRRNNIISIIDKGRYLICQTSRGLLKFDKATKVFTRPWLSGSDSSFFSGKDAGVPWIFPRGNDYWVITHFRHPGKVAPDPHFLLYKTDSAFSVIQEYKVPYDIASSIDRVKAGSLVVQDSYGILWMGTADKGVFRWDPATGQSTHYENEPGNPESLPSNIIYSILIDRDQNVWVITNKGLSRLKKKRVDFHSYRKVSNVTSDVVPMYVTGIQFVAGKTANYLVTTSANSGIWTTSFDRNALGSLRFQPLEFKEKPENFDHILDIEKRRDAFWVVCTDGSGGYNKGSLFKLPINAQTGLPEGRVIQRLFRDEKNPRSIGGFISAGIQKDEQENFWMGITICNCNQTIGVDTVIEKTALDKVVFTEEGEVDTVLHFRHDPKDPNSLISESLIGGGGVWRTYPEGKDSRWVATTAGIDLFRNGRFEHVLNQYSNWVSKCSDGTILAGAWGKGLFEGRKEGDHYRFTKVEALGDQSIEAIEEDRLGRLWIGTHRGLFLYNRPEQTVQEFGPEDGVQGDRFISSTQTPDGIMIFGGENGLTLFDPMSFHLNEIRPQPLIRQLKVNNKRAIVEGHPSAPADFIIPQNIGSLPELVLDHTSNLFTLEFAAMELTNPEKNLYAYKLEGAKGDWVQTDWKNRSVTYMNLNAGTYTFRVKAANADGIWSDRETTLAIRVLPPPWKTWWAYTLYFLTVTGSTWYYIKSRERSLRKRQVELEQTVTERTADVVAEKKEVEKQRNRSDELLLNILPSEVAEELKLKGSADAKQFDNVTVMFTDFKDFTQISERLTPAELVAEINAYFKAFDRIITKFNIEKIKTIGDSYMCVGGLPVANETNAADVVNAALEIQQFIKQNAEQGRKEGKEPFEIRIGIHTGPVVAGIVGIKKFAYDIWGDTVNLASRMESSGEAGKVNVSQSTYVRLRDNVNFKFEFRGKIEAKHKGVIEMYFVERA